MSRAITISTSEFDYIFKKYGSRILINGTEFDLNFANMEDEQQKKECHSTYRMLIKEGKSKEYAKVKASLFFAPYVEIGLAPPMELMDFVVLYLLGFEQLTPLNKDMKIVITDCEVYVSGNKNVKNGDKINKYGMATTGSSHISYDYGSLLDALIKDANM